MARLAGLRHLVLFTDFARAVVERAALSGHAGPELSVLPHGTDTKTFGLLCYTWVPALGQTLILFNPAFHAIDGVRYGLTGYAAWSPWASASST